ncbi:transcription regulator HTH, apses-type DNA-binding domain-containing protein [Gorgonomyces haynaldii]|nr:transcription regulator HTH, apses-type DNA-binding domain-containing protein [Gorgonomyces haynaldii]
MFRDNLYTQSHWQKQQQPLVLPTVEHKIDLIPTALGYLPTKEELFHPSNFYTIPANKRFIQPMRNKSTAPNQPRVLSDYGDGKLYEATYAGIQVWEMIIGPHQVMRRREDGWINATHILKVAGVDKGPRTKILEREVHHEPHEKIQGGFGKYQGTWVPIERGRQFAIEYSVDQILEPILSVK